MRNLVRYILAAGILSVGASIASAQAATPTPKPTPFQLTKLDLKNLNAEQVVELTVIYYSGLGGRERLNQIRKTTIERGRTSITSVGGKTEQATYQRFVIRGENSAKEKIRLDQDFPNARYALIFNDDKTIGVFNNTVFTPTEDASRRFENQIVHGIDALLRYQENGSKFELAPREKVMGVDYYVLDITDKQDRKTRFYVSVKSFRVMMLTYEEGGVKYKRKFYDYNYAQGTLVPFRSVLWAGDKQVEETDVGTITFGQRLDEGLFNAS